MAIKIPIQNFLFLLLCFVFFANKGLAQDSTKAFKDCDDSELVIEICTHIPGNHDPSKCYRPYVCSYTYISGKLVVYEVTGFDMILEMENGETEISSSKGNRIIVPAMLWMMSKASKNKLNQLFLDNVQIKISAKQNKTIAGRRLIKFIE